MKHLVVIGAGPGGYEVAIKAASKGLKVTLIDKDEVGGTCLNSGCIPTKALYKNAEVLHEVKHSDVFGIHIHDFDFDFSKVQERKNHVVNQLKTNIIQMLVKTNVTFIKGEASFVDEETVSVKTDEEVLYISGDYFIVATGSTEKIIPIEGHDLEDVLTSKEMLEIDEVPKKLVVIGGGVIGVEMASIFNEFGCDVVVIEFLDKIIANFDLDMSKRLKAYMKKQGIEVHTDTACERIEKTPEGLVVYAKTKKGKEVVVDASHVLMSTGRISYTDRLNLEAIQVDYDKFGIKVNENFQTNIPHIYAVGDVTGQMMLAHTATFQSFKALDHILGNNNHTKFEITPACVFTFPEIASVGLTEDEAKSKYDEVNVNKFLFRANGKALTMNETEGFIKVIAHDDQLLGVHIIGPQASTEIHEATVIIERQIPISECLHIIHAHPTLSETLLEALRGLVE